MKHPERVIGLVYICWLLYMGTVISAWQNYQPRTAERLVTYEAAPVYKEIEPIGAQQ